MPSPPAVAVGPGLCSGHCCYGPQVSPPTSRGLALVFRPLVLFYCYQGLRLGLCSTVSRPALRHLVTIRSLKGGGAPAEVGSSDSNWFSEMPSRSFPSASVHPVSHPLLPELK